TIGGNCGSSLAPLLYGSLESIREWTDVNRVNVGWQRVKEFLRVLEKQGIGVNFGTLVGHSTIRRAILGNTMRDLTDREREVCTRTLRDALEDGALGLSTGLGYVHAHATPFYEIRELLRVVADYHGIYTTHLRNEEEDLQSSVHEALRLITESHVSGLISHLRPLIGFEWEFGKAIRLIEAAGETTDVHFDGYPHTSSFVPIYTLLPRWIRTGGIETMRDHLKRPGIQQQILRELPKFNDDDIVVVEAHNIPEMNGKTIGAIAKNRNVPIREALIKVMLTTGLQATVLNRNVNEDLAMQSLLSPRALVASNAPAVPDTSWFRHERFHGTFMKFISFVRDAQLMSLEKAIQKVTSIPAKKYRLHDRGEIKEGKFADAVLIKDDKITDVFVNGVQTVRFGKLLGARAGRVLRRT
ncbi:MAG: amidohydrolase family protein, partial [Patescibacteria group bacterium]